MKKIILAMLVSAIPAMASAQSWQTNGRETLFQREAVMGGQVLIQCTASMSNMTPVYMTFNDGRGTSRASSVSITVMSGERVTYQQAVDADIWFEEGNVNVPVFENASGDGKEFFDALRGATSLTIRWDGNGQARVVQVTGRGSTTAINQSYCR